MRYIKKDENGIVVAVSEIQFDETYELSDEEYEVGFDGKIYSKTEMESFDYLTKKVEFDNDIKLSNIRFQRETECFSVINRGALWYDKLTDEQKAELAAWYQAWLDAPQTKVIPARLEWLK